MAKKKVNTEHSATETTDGKKVDKLAVARKALEKDFGVMPHTMGEVGDLHMSIISSGCLSLDIALGVGGFVKGRVYEVFGAPSGGKTTLAMSVIAEAQKRGLKALFVDAEHSADPQLFKAMGVDIDSLEYIRLYTGDDNLNALELYLKTTPIDVVVVDSVSALVPKNEAEAHMDDQFMGLQARLMSKALRKLTPVVSKTDTLLIFINQVRYKIGAYGDPTTTTGGEALNFYASGRISVSGGESKSTRIPHPITGEVMGHKTTFKIVKNKFAPPHREAVIPLIYGVGYDRIGECLKLAVDYDFIIQKGAYYYHTGEDTHFAQGEANAVEYLKENEDIYNNLRQAVMKAAGLIKNNE